MKYKYSRKEIDRHICNTLLLSEEDISVLRNMLLEPAEMKGKQTMKKARWGFEIVLKYKGKKYIINEVWKELYGWDTALEGVTFMYKEGNYSCDCNRSLFIKRQCDKNFPEMECGDKIKLLSIKPKYGIGREE